MLLTFSDILAQDRAIETLRSCIESDRLPHGLLFAGPPGVGKATTASALAAIFLCENLSPSPGIPGEGRGEGLPRSPKTAPCGKCQSCILLAAGNHPDFHLVYKELIRHEKDKQDSKARDLSIDVLRTHLVDKAGLKSSMNRGKVFIVEQADDMNAAGQNAILKTLEEPQGRTLIILLAEQPGSLLSTIRSRCQIILFAPLPEKIVLEGLKKRGIAPDLAKTAAHFAHGSLGMALKWLQDGVIAAAAQLQQHLQSLLSTGRADPLQDFFKKSAEAYAAKQIERDKLTSKDIATRDGLAIYLKIASQILRAQLTHESDPDRLEQLCRTIDAIVRAETYLHANVNMALIYQQLAVSLERELSPAGV